MKSIAEGIYTRGKGGNKYVRRRIPAGILAAYPANKTHITRSLRTTDSREAKERARVALARIDAEFKLHFQKRDLGLVSLFPKRVTKLDDEQLQSIARYWSRQVLLTDERHRQQGLDDDEFDELGAQLVSQRAELGRMLAQGKSMNVFPALRGFLHLTGLDFDPEPEEAKRASYIFLRTVVETLDHQLARQRGEVVHCDAVAAETQHPRYVVAPEQKPVDPNEPTWEKVFDTWRDHSENRPKATTIASQTPWRELRGFMERKGLHWPAEVTALLMTEFVTSMRDRGLEVPTINERISKVRAIYKIAVGMHVLKANPAAETLGFKQSSVKKRRKRRLPFDDRDLALLFGSEVFVQHKRSRGQSGEATYWIPLLMFYTGARPEEVAGLALSDLVEVPELGWHLNIVDRPCGEDRDLFEDEDVPESHRRTLKNAPSVRRIPVPPQLLDLGLLRYVEWVRANGSTVFFPTLSKDWHGKLAGAFSKFFGRYKRMTCPGLFGPAET